MQLSAARERTFVQCIANGSFRAETMRAIVGGTTTGGLVPEKPAEIAVSAAREFAKRCHDELGISRAYLFGSLVYRDGERFSEEVSDVDLALVMPADMQSPSQRTEFAAKLLDLKRDLETKLVTGLSRPTTVPVGSLLLLTETEIGADIHKDGAEGFFEANEFLDLASGERVHGMPGVGDRVIRHRLVRQCLRFAQKKRHAFLSLAANGKGSLAPYEGELPLPKDALRHAAMAGALRTTGAPPGAEFDTQEGLSELLRVLLPAAPKDRSYEDLRLWLLNKMSTRKGTLEAGQQLLLAEMIGSLAESALERMEQESRRPAFRVESTPFFYERVGDAFPGKRGIYWTSGPEDVEMRLNRLLGGELRFGGSTPIWLFRGGISVPVANFQQLGPETFLFDHYEVKVSRLALSESDSYYRCFVYVEGEPLAPIGINPHAAESAARARAEGRIYDEEYGVTDDGLILTREEYDDGAAERDGKIIETSGRTRLMCRYLTPVNFVLCAQMSPINNTKYDLRMRELLDRMLQGEDLLSTISEEVERLPRRDDN
jgi:predicted nucleotidyltransferase